MKNLLTISTMLCCHLLWGQSCDIDGVLYYDFEDIVTIFNNNNCNSCHTAAGEASGWRYDDYSYLTSVDDCDNPIIVHGNASESALYDKLNGGTARCGEPMPSNRLPLTQQELYAVESWINAGATENCIPLYTDVQDLFTTLQCSTCHTPESSWSSTSYEHILGAHDATICADLVVPYDAKSSALYQLLIDQVAECDNVPAHEPLSAQALLLIRDWINAGALEGSASLPVELADFDLELISASQYVKLYWTSTLEIGTDRYIVERSTDGRHFSVISEVKAKGSSTNIENYSYTDVDQYLGQAYYRLRIIDLDGTFTYSHIISLRKEPTYDVLTLAPSPIMGSDVLSLTWYSRIERPTAYAHVVNAAGQEVQKIRIQEGQNQVPLKALDDGLYYVVIHDFFDSYQLGRFIVIN